MKIGEGLSLKGKIKIDVYRAGYVEAAKIFLDALAAYKDGLASYNAYKRSLGQNPNAGPETFFPKKIFAAEQALRLLHLHYFLHTAVECPNLIMDSANYGLDIIIQRLVGNNTYSLNILYGEIGTGSTAPALTDTGLTTPTNRAAVGFQQDYGATDAILQFFFADSQLANETYNEFGTFIDGTSTIGSGQLFNHALLSPAYVKAAGTDTTIQLDVSVANS
jgi:hypothetical protein